MKRREFLALGVAIPALAAVFDPRKSPARAVPEAAGLRVERSWKGDLCRSRLVNHGSSGARVHEVILFDIRHELPASTPLYGESFQMLSQTSGTLGNPVDLGYNELKHFKFPQPDGVTVVSGLMAISPEGGETTVLAFTSCRRFNGRFYLSPGRIQVVLDTDGLELAPGAAWELEEFFTASGPRQALFSRIADQIGKNHPTRIFRPEPTGWCSWYCFGPRVTAQNVLDNLDAISRQVPSLKYVQIDDGYQSAMGDWLATGTAFGGDVLGVLKEIRRRGFEPAIWVAPFIAEKDSKVFREHPDWFLKNDAGDPLASNTVSFGGWRHAPWYVLDGTHPETQSHLENLFRTMRREWGCAYFKLDASCWGALHGGRHHDARATRVEAYRRGMQAIRRGSEDAFLLGCNQPIWASFGLIDGSRSSDDIKRTWAKISAVARQNLSRNWQNGKLWWNDPDAICLDGDLPLNEFVFHATACYATGGMALSGDDLSKMPAERMAMLRKLVPPTGVAATFEDDSLRVGWMRERVALFNWSDEAREMEVRLPRRCRLTDFWTEKDLGMHQGEFKIVAAGRSAVLLKLE